MGEAGLACTAGLAGVALLLLRATWNESVGEISRREDVEKECHEINDWSFMKYPKEIFSLESQWSDYKNRRITLTQEEVDSLKEQIYKFRGLYDEALNETFKSSENFFDQLKIQENLGEEKVVCLAAYVTTNTNSRYLDSIIDALESKIDNYGSRTKQGGEVKFSNLLKLYKFCLKERHRIFYERNLHENLTTLP